MKILYTYSGITGRVSGVSRYVYEIAIRLLEMHAIRIEIFHNTNVYLASLVKSRPAFFLKYNFKGKNRIRHVIEELYLLYVLKRESFDIVHHTGESVNVFKWTQKPVVITVHDMIPEKFYLSDTKRIIRRKRCMYAADGIICVSQNTKKDMLQVYPELSSKIISVIYHGNSNFGYNSYKRVVYDKYILYVGSRYNEYKNFVFMLCALKNVLLNNNLKLLCTGTAFNKNEQDIIHDLQLSEYVVNLGVVSDEDLANLYHFAQCFVYPSKYEGFGLPILEAFCHECPICISNTSCFPEIAGDAAAYFDPYDGTDIERCINEVVTNSGYRLELIAAGNERLKLFSWDVASKKTESFYNEVISSKYRIV